MSTADSNLTRDELITMAYKKLGSVPSSNMKTDAALVLNLIIREEDAKGTAQSKDLWAVAESSLKLTANKYIYTAGPTTDSLENDIMDLITVYYRDTTGSEVPVKLYSTEQYESIANKYETGDVEVVYFKKASVMSNQSLVIWPAPASVGATTTITGTDGLYYNCIKSHTSASTNQPITGYDWKMYWGQHAASGSAWASGQDYTAGELLRYTFKRALYDFDTSSDNPDMPQAWTRYLMYRLAHDLSPEVKVSVEDRAWLKREYLDAYNTIFPSTQPVTTEIHNKGMFY